MGALSHSPASRARTLSPPSPSQPFKKDPLPPSSPPHFGRASPCLISCSILAEMAAALSPWIDTAFSTPKSAATRRHAGQ